jgi:hypothetical protein
MDWLTFISSLARALAWPAVFVFFLWRFAPEITGVLNALKLRRFRFGEAEAEFGETVERAVADLEDSRREQPIEDKPIPPELYDLIDKLPNYAVLEAWKRLEKAVVDYTVLHLGARPGQPFRRHLLLMVDKGPMSSSIASAIQDLYEARNQVVHRVDFQIDRSEAVRFVDTVEDVLGVIEGYAPPAGPPPDPHAPGG